MRLLACVCAGAFAVTLLILRLGGVGADVRGAAARPPAGVVSGRAARSTDARIAQLQAALRQDRASADSLVLLGGAYLQKVRETGDATMYARADQAIALALAREPANAGAFTERGVLRLARHDFRGALQDGTRAHRLAPEVVKPLGVLVDANVELGRYGAAGRWLQLMVDRKPNLDSYARVSYFRELHGDVRGAREALRLAVAAGGEIPENVAYVQTLRGNLELSRGRRGPARRDYRSALAGLPSYLPARAGLARIDVQAGRLDQAIVALRDVVGRLPLPEYIVALGEAELAAGRRADAVHDLELIDAEQRLLRGAGVNVDVDVAIFEADHGDPSRGVRFAQAAMRSAPSVRSADALGWALTRAGRPREGLRWGRRALRLGSVDPMFLFHAGMSARAAGRPREARRLLATALAINPRFSPLSAPDARRVLRTL